MKLLTASLLAPLLAAGLHPCLSAAVTLNRDTEFRVELLGPLHTDTTRKGDKISARVLSPPEFGGDFVTGEVGQSKSSGKIKGTSRLRFSFDKLHHKGQDLPIRSSVRSVINSRGTRDVDEEGTVIRKKNRVGSAVGSAAAGAILGAVFGGAKGAAIGAGAGAAAASLVLIRFTAKGARISFDPGSQFVLSVSPGRRR